MVFKKGDNFSHQQANQILEASDAFQRGKLGRRLPPPKTTAIQPAIIKVKNNTGGALTVSDGTHSANLSLLGQYSAAGFASAADSHGGTIITIGPAQPNSTDQNSVTKPVA